MKLDRAASLAALLALASFVACSGEAPVDVTTDGAPATEDGGATDGSSFDFGDVSASDAAVDGGSCEAPDFLIVLDRSDSMGTSAGTADGGKLPAKWAIAEAALGKLVAPPNDQGLRFGLEVFPDVAGSCSSGKVLVDPGLARSGPITSALAQTKLAGGTPMGAPLQVARKTLATVKSAGRRQFVLLVTDGGETCSSNRALPAVQALAADGVKTYVVGFGAGVDPTTLNNVACAGETAPSQSTSCTKTQAGWTWNGKTPNLYYQAQDQQTLAKALAAVAGNTCCSCTVN